MRRPPPPPRAIPAAELELVVHGAPVSAQTRNRTRLMDWRQRIRLAAATAWPADRPPIAVAVRPRITHYGERPGVDIDNLIKPIQDALQGVAYHDDRQVKDVTGTWRDINGRYPLRYISPCLAAAFGDGREFVHVRLWLAGEAEELG